MTACANAFGSINLTSHLFCIYNHDAQDEFRKMSKSNEHDKSSVHSGVRDVQRLYVLRSEMVA